MHSELTPYIQKVASTAFSRWFAKNSTKARMGKPIPQDYMQMYGTVNKKTGKLDVTPKMIAKAEYEIAKQNSGNTGREAFKRTARSTKKDSRGRHLEIISKGDALGKSPKGKTVLSTGDYATEILRRKQQSSPTKGVKDSKGRLKETIATREKVRTNATRLRNKYNSGVGDLNVGTAKEVKDRHRARGRSENMTPEQLEKKRARGRLKNMTPEQIEKNRARKRIENMTPEQIERVRERARTRRRKKAANRDMDKLLEKHNLIKKAAHLVKQAAASTSTIKGVSNAVSGFTKSVDKVTGQGIKAVKPGGMNKLPGIKNVTNAIKTTKGTTSSGSPVVTPLSKTSAAKLTKYVASKLGKNPKIEATKAYKKLKESFSDTDVLNTAFVNDMKKKFPDTFGNVDFHTPYRSGALSLKQMYRSPYSLGFITHDLKRGGNINPLTKASKQVQEYLKKYKDFKAVKPQSKKLNSKKKDLGSLKSNSKMTKNSSYTGETMNTPFITSAYQAGVHDALYKVANMGQPMQPMQPMMDPNTGMPIDPNTGMPMQAPPMPPQMPPQQPVAQPMMDVQANMGAPMPQQPAPAATQDEMQQVQNSGLTSKDIESAAKVIQTVAEMKANADMMQMEPQDPAAMGQPMMAGGGGAPAAQG